MKIALACGGTGGHIFPGLATGDVLRRRGHDVTLWLAGKDVENMAVQGWTGRVITVKAEGLPTSPSARVFSAGYRLVRAVRACTQLMKTEKPDLVLAMGSYASVGPVIAAARQRIPYILHESNAVPGRATSLLSRWADAVAISFEETRSHLRRRRNLAMTGMPLRREIAERARNAGSREPGREFRLLVMGGSRGAHAINQSLPESLGQVQASGAQFRVTHLAGMKDADAVRAAYARASVRCDVHTFVHDMAGIYADCDLAICRAGAATCAELLAFGVPSLLIPYPSAVRDHQTANAQAMERMGAAQMISERDLTAAWLAGYVGDAIANRARLTAMGAAAQAHATLDAADALALLATMTVEEHHVA